MKEPPKSNVETRLDRRALLVTLCVFALALFLRVWGIDWGLPNKLHTYSYHPDELIQLAAAFRVDIPHLRLNPGFFNYPSFYIYLTSFALSVTTAWGVVSTLRDGYLVARLITAVMGAGSVFLVYYAGRRSYGKAAGLLAALIFAVIPLSVVDSHYATVDVPAAFWVAACLAAAAVITPSSRVRTYILAGLMAGFAAGTKYNAGLVILAPLVAHFVQNEGPVWRRALDSRMWITAAGAVVGFLFTTPGALIWPGKFWHDFTYEIGHSASGHGLVFINTGPGWWFTIADTFVYGLGLPLTIITLTGVIYAVWRREKRNWPYVVFFVAYYLMISFSEVRFSRYAAPLLPAAAILAAKILVDGMTGSYRRLWTVVAAVVVAQALLFSFGLDMLFVGQDPREAALAWFDRSVPRGTTIGLANPPWFYTPPFASGFGELEREDRIASARKSSYKLVTSDVDWDPSVLQAHPQYVVMSDYEERDGERSGDPSAISFLHTLRQDYRCVETFGEKEPVRSLLFVHPSRLPHDMKYMHPTIQVWKRI